MKSLRDVKAEGRVRITIELTIMYHFPTKSKSTSQDLRLKKNKKKKRRRMKKISSFIMLRSLKVEPCRTLWRYKGECLRNNSKLL